MAVTAVSDIIVPELFTKYSQERTATVWELIKSGIVVRTPEFDQRAASDSLMPGKPGIRLDVRVGIRHHDPYARKIRHKEQPWPIREGQSPFAVPLRLK